MSQSRIDECLQRARSFELEVNAGVADIGEIGEISRQAREVMSDDVPLSFEAQYIHVVQRIGDTLLRDEKPREVNFVTGKFLGFWAFPETIQVEDDEITRFSVGSLIKALKSERMLWTPVRSARTHNLLERLRDNSIAMSILQVLNRDEDLSAEQILEMLTSIPRVGFEELCHLNAFLNYCIEPTDYLKAIYPRAMCIAIHGEDPVNYRLNYPVRFGVSKQGSFQLFGGFAGYVMSTDTGRVIIDINEPHAIELP